MDNFYRYDALQFGNRPNAVRIKVDGPTTKNIDDAVLSVQGDSKMVVTVSIADVASQLAIGFTDNLKAYNRGYSQYLPNGNIPMLP